MTEKRCNDIEFSRLLPLERMGGQICDREIVADDQERTALARRFQLLSLERLEARLSVRGKGPHLILVEGRFTAEVTQSCVISLLPIENTLRGEFRQLFSTAPEVSLPAPGEVLIDVEEDDPPEAISEFGLDLGEIVAQQMALALDPYPRDDPARLAAASDNLDIRQELEPQPRGDTPFSVLRDLKVGK